MKKNRCKEQPRLYLGVDIGGTKIQASLVRESGKIVGREKCATPRKKGPERVVATLERCMDDAIRKGGITPGDLTAIGVAVPGVVDPRRGLVVIAPNMELTGVDLGALLKARFQAPIAIGNDGNFGTYGEAWLGSARRTRSALFICVGTGIGGGLVQRGKLWRGSRDSAGEIGHMKMQIDGPVCGCGGRGCFEAMASRTAIERDLREAVAAGRKSILPELAGGDLSVIRSGMIRKALNAEDELVSEVVRRAAEILGHACLSVRHLIDPEVIVLGGGLIEACSDFILPIVEHIVGSDTMPGARDGGRIVLSTLGDDAVALGAVAAARRLVGRSPFKKRFRDETLYPRIESVDFGEITIGRQCFERDVCILADGKVMKRDKRIAKKRYGSSHTLGPKELASICKRGPEVLFIGTGMSGKLALSDDARQFLDHRAIKYEIFRSAEAADRYNRSKLRKAALIHVTC